MSGGQYIHLLPSSSIDSDGASPRLERARESADSNGLSKPAWLRQRQTVPRKRWIVAGLLGVVALIGIVKWTGVLDDKEEVDPGRSTLNLPKTACPTVEMPWMHPSSSLKFGDPTLHATDNLREDSHYVTGFAQAGFTNQFIAYLHLVYLGQISNRIPIIPPIIPAAHVSETAGIIPFGHIFNLTNLRAALRSPILEWTDVKSIASNASVIDQITASDPAIDHFGCWSTRQGNEPHANWVGNHENVLRIDMSFTRVPEFAFFDPKNANDPHVSFFGLSAIITPGTPHPEAEHERVQVMQKSRLEMELKPDERMSCFDLIYYVSTGVKEFEFEEKWSPAWTHVGRHLRWTNEMQRIGEEYLRKGLGLHYTEEIPKMITVHIRRGDFKNICKDGEKPPCYLPLEKYKNAVEDVRKEILEKHGVNVTQVLVTSNEKDPAFWQTLREEYNWSYLNHTALLTFEDRGEWYPLLVDKIVLSMGLGFVGTRPSTFSVYNARRVEDWNQGVAKLLNWWE